MKKEFWIIAVATLIFATTLHSALTPGLWTNVDHAINSWIPTIQTPFLTIIANAIALAFDTVSILVISIIIAVILWKKKEINEAFIFFGVMIVNAGILFLLKEIVHKARPENMIAVETNYSFPSGHAMTSLVFLGVLAYLIYYYSNFKHKTIFPITAIIIGIIGFSRLYLNVHWLSDVIAGYSLGIIILIITITYLKKIQATKQYKAEVELIESKTWIKTKIRHKTRLNKKK